MVVGHLGGHYQPHIRDEGSRIVEAMQEAVPRTAFDDIPDTTPLSGSPCENAPCRTANLRFDYAERPRSE